MPYPNGADTARMSAVQSRVPAPGPVPRREEMFGRVGPLAAASLLALASIALPPASRDDGGLVAAALLTAALLVLAVLERRHWLPRWAWAGAPLGSLAVIALLRDATGAAESGLGWLALLPVMWLALHGTRGELAAAVAGVGAVFALPVALAGAPDYPATELQAALVAMFACAAVGFTVQQLVRAYRRETRTMRAIAEATRALSGSIEGGAARRAICEAARELTGAPVVTLAEPDEPDRLTVSAAAGAELPPISVQIGREQSGITVAFLSRRPFFAADAATHPAVSPRTLALIGAASVLHQPVLLGDEAVGVLSMWWTRRAPEPSERVTAAIGLLAGHAAAAIERSDLLERLGTQARTDALTGLPNRRTWDEQLPLEIERARAAQRPLSVAILDMDRFRAYNEAHGHPGGDRLLKETTAAWRGVVRAVDVVARYGGEEFGVLLPGAGSQEAVAVVERARAVTPAGQTCSAGIATWDGVESASALVARADRALYDAKQAGRDRAVLA